MNTFLPYPDFNQSVECLDDKRLNKQRAEVKAILRMIRMRKYHPAADMWVGYEWYLMEYGKACCHEQFRRGFIDNLAKEFALEQSEMEKGPPPPWLGDEVFHSSMRANLLRKDFEHYSKFGWIELPMDVYYWPSKHWKKVIA